MAFLHLPLSLEELAGLLLENGYGTEPKDDKDSTQDDPVPPNAVAIDVHIGQDSLTVPVAKFRTTVPIEFGLQGQPDGVREGAQPLGPPEPDGDQVRPDKEAGKEHLRHKEHRQEFLGHLGVFDGATQSDGEGCAGHGERVEDEPQIHEGSLEANHEVRDEHEDHDLQCREGSLHGQA